jgi:tRNA pseudouridine32 synthase / 23S rRNA pseudouridine746 synthase
MELGLQILYEDAALLVLNKPAGMLAVPGRGTAKQDSLATRVQAVYADALIVHRLDMATSGLMLMARGKEIQRQLSQLFAQRAVQKNYIAVVAGRMACPSGEINLPLITDWPNRPRQMVDHACGKTAITRYRVQDYDAASNSTRVELVPITGRSHQLRVHLQALGHAILGDALYADSIIREQAPRLLLHATALAFRHPVDQQPVHYLCDVPF